MSDRQRSDQDTGDCKRFETGAIATAPIAGAMPKQETMIWRRRSNMSPSGTNTIIPIIRPRRVSVGMYAVPCLTLNVRAISVRSG